MRDLVEEIKTPCRPRRSEIARAQRARACVERERAWYGSLMASVPRKPPKSPTKKPPKSAAPAKTTKRATARTTQGATVGAKRPPSSSGSRGWVKIGSEFDFDAAPRSPLESAQDLMYRAWETRDPRRSIALAREALGHSPDCADAYTLLARTAATTPDEAIALYRQGVEAGERAIGDREEFEATVGHFWGVLETRPYVRARTGLADALWAAGQRDNAVQHYHDLLRLNPNDNQGLRYRLTNWLIELDRDADAMGLLEKYDEGDSCLASYPLALLVFRARGDSAESRALLKAAIRSNPHVPALLVGAKKMPKDPPAFMGVGDTSEAISYVLLGASAWQASKGAIDWLRSRSV